MAGSIQVTDTIDGSGFPLVFKVAQGRARPATLAVTSAVERFRVQARALGGHQKEAVASEGEAGTSWRMVSDEGPGLNGTDLAPFPLGFMNAGSQADLLGRIERVARTRGVEVRSLAAELVTDYAFEGSFFKGDGRGSAKPAAFKVKIASGATANEIRDVVRRALDASPIIAMLRTPLVNTFALYANGRRRALTRLQASSRPDVVDPLKAWTSSPRPLAGSEALAGLIEKDGPANSAGAPVAALPGQAARIDIPIHGNAEFKLGMTRAVTWANRHGGSRFAIRSDERADHDLGPTGLSLAFAGVAFCLMTQLLRYVEYHKMNVRALRIVQDANCEILDGRARAYPLDTHVFVHGEESDETMEGLLQMAANTCYLHAALHGSLDPVVAIELNGAPLA